MRRVSAALLGGFSAGSASCACSCTGGSGGVTGNCSTSVAMYESTSSNCPVSSPTTGGNIQTNFCFAKGNFDDWTMAPYAPTNVSGTCGTGTVTPTITAPSFADEARACAAVPRTDACAGVDDVCVVEPAAPFESGALCVLQAGDHTCPAAFPTKRLHYTGSNDTRACQSCSCSGSGASYCEASYTVYSGGSCGSSLSTGTAASNNWACVLQQSGAASSVRIQSVDFVADCAPDGFDAQPTGSADPTGETTVCCR